MHSIPGTFILHSSLAISRHLPNCTFIVCYPIDRKPNPWTEDIGKHTVDTERGKWGSYMCVCGAKSTTRKSTVERTKKWAWFDREMMLNGLQRGWDEELKFQALVSLATMKARQCGERNTVIIIVLTLRTQTKMIITYSTRSSEISVLSKSLSTSLLRCVLDAGMRRVSCEWSGWNLPLLARLVRHWKFNREGPRQWASSPRRWQACEVATGPIFTLSCSQLRMESFFFFDFKLCNLCRKGKTVSKYYSVKSLAFLTNI